MDIDVSKENIQPLRGGRNLTQLGTALQAQSDVEVHRQLQLQKEEHEAAIRNYEGTDPLDPWFNYIQWVEQSFPKHGHEGHIDKVIKECLQLFEKDERYFQDRRFVKLWIKYIDCLTNPLEIYQRLYNSGIGVQCSEFYRAWACYCEESGDYKKANQVYVLGLQAQAQPLDELEQAHMNFQLFFAQRMLHDDSPTKRKAASALAETRMALTSLKSFKRRNIANAPVYRVGESIKSVIPGVVRQQHNTNSERVPSSNIMVNVYEDLPSTSRLPVPGEHPGPASLVQSCNVENEKEVGIWTNAKTKMVHTNVVPHQPLPFTPYVDDEDELKLPATHMAYCLDDPSFNVPLCVPDPPDSTKIPCYNKTQVYADNTEYSLEEIKGRRYQRKVCDDKAINISIKKQNSSQVNEQTSHCSALETLANCALDAEHDHLGHMMPLAIPSVQNITKVQNIHSPGEPKVLVNLDSKEFSELANPTKKNEESHQQSFNVMDSDKPSTSSFNNPNNYGKNNLAEEFNKSLMNNFLSDSVTINTKEARWELRNLFNDNNEPSIMQPVVQQFDMPNFDIHEDRSMTMNFNAKKKQAMQDVTDAISTPQDKENANKYPSPQQVAKKPYYEEPSNTQVFNFNIKTTSTPNSSQFKKPMSYLEQSRIPSVPKYIDDSGIENVPVECTKKEESPQNEPQPVADQGTGLSVIMEATREYTSKSGSSSSGHQSTRTNFTGYTTTPYAEKTQGSTYQDSMYQVDPSKMNSLPTQQRMLNGQFCRKSIAQSTTVPYLSHDHQYQKPVAQTYNGYTAQRTIQSQGYQPNYGVQYQQAYGVNQMPNQGYNTSVSNYHTSQEVQNQHQVQSPHHPSIQNTGIQSPGMQNAHNPGMQSPHNPGIQSPHYPGIQSPHNPGMQSPHSTALQSPIHASSPVPGFQSPPLHYQQMGYQSPGHVVQGNLQGYPNMRQDYHVQPDYMSHERQQHVYVNQPQQAAFQSPPHQSQFGGQYYQRSNHNSNSNLYAQQNYAAMHNQYQANSTAAGTSHHQLNTNQNYNVMQNYRQPKQLPEGNYPGQSVSNANVPFQIYQSPNPNHSMRQDVQNTNMQEKYQAVETMNSLASNVHSNAPQQKHVAYNIEANQNSVPQNNGTAMKQPTPHKSPTSALRSIRHEQPNPKVGQNASDIGFSNQFLNFISNRNEPKDNANTPKFTNSPNISQKMHKNLYVSSPEQAQMPPSSGLSDSDSKDSLTAQTVTHIQAAKVTQGPEKQKDISKRQLDFEHRVELQCEDSRDSVGRDSRISSIYSRQSDFQSDGYGMDVDSENSMECATFKSSHSISLIETSEIPRPADIDFPKEIDPFNKKILNSLLEYVKFPNKTHAEGYNEVRSIPKLQLATVSTVGNSRFSIDKQLGKGNYGAVFLCLDLNSNKSVAVKYQKPSRPWEFYICQEIKARIKDPFMLHGYMDITTAFIGENASLFVSEYSKYGSLLDVANKVRVATSKCMNELIVFLLTSEMLSIVHYLHKAQIIHADIKPDNFLLMKIPTQEWRRPSLQLIDLGCSIDMSLFPEGTTFRELIATAGFTCTEMREGKPWTYQTDLYCLAGTIHVILMGSYMKVINRLGQWNIDKKLPRYMNVLWDKIFTTLLNVPDCNTLPDLMDLKNDVDSLLRSIDNLGSQLRNLANILKSR